MFLSRWHPRWQGVDVELLQVFGPLRGMDRADHLVEYVVYVEVWTMACCSIQNELNIPKSYAMIIDIIKSIWDHMFFCSTFLWTYLTPRSNDRTVRYNSTVWVEYDDVFLNHCCLATKSISWANDQTDCLFDVFSFVVRNMANQICLVWLFGASSNKN